jgi:DNA-binding MarR family transcriptional regulator
MATMMQDETIRQLLNRRDLASARHRSAMSRRLGLSESEMLAVAHLAQRGRLTPSELAELLDLSSGGVTALVQRLELAGHVGRTRHPTDRRSVQLELAPALVTRAAAAFGPLVAALDEVTSELSEPERAVVRRFLARVALATEEHTARAHAELDRGAAAPSTPVPALWG